MPMKIQEAYKTPSRLDPKRKKKMSPSPIMIKTPNMQNKETIFRTANTKKAKKCIKGYLSELHPTSQWHHKIAGPG